jgi:hypothetical protein
LQRAAAVRKATLVLAVVSITSSAAAEESVSIVTAEVMRAPGHNEALLGSHIAMLSFVFEHAHIDFVDFTGGTSIDVRGGFLGGAYRIERPGWGVFAGVHGFTLWNDAIRYLTPWAGARIGDETRATIGVRSAGVFVKALGDDSTRDLTRDFDIAARLSTPVWFARVEARARYRDIATAALHVRDVFVGAGVELAIRRGAWRGAPTFVGIGWRHERWREEVHVIERGVSTAARPRWQALLWLEVDLGVRGPDRK